VANVNEVRLSEVVVKLGLNDQQKRSLRHAAMGLLQSAETRRMDEISQADIASATLENMYSIVDATNYVVMEDVKRLFR
jgi:hypothetical protein